MTVSDVIVGVVLLVVFIAFIGACLLVIRISLRLVVGPRRPAPPRRPPLRQPPDDWDDEEYVSRHHH
jgi:hypothetical protein